jgi:hypothetical protein
VEILVVNCSSLQPGSLDVIEDRGKMHTTMFVRMIYAAGKNGTKISASAYTYKSSQGKCSNLVKVGGLVI